MNISDRYIFCKKWLSKPMIIFTSISGILGYLMCLSPENFSIISFFCGKKNLIIIILGMIIVTLMELAYRTFQQRKKKDELVVTIWNLFEKYSSESGHHNLGQFVKDVVDILKESKVISAAIIYNFEKSIDNMFYLPECKNKVLEITNHLKY